MTTEQLITDPGESTRVAEDERVQRHDLRAFFARFGAFGQLVQFLLVGATGMCVDLAVFILLMRVVSPQAGRVIAIGVAMTWNFILNRQFTFGEARNRPLFAQYVLFCLSCSLGAAISWTIFYVPFTAIPLFHEQPLAAALVGIVVSTISNFVLSKYVAFK